MASLQTLRMFITRLKYKSPSQISRFVFTRTPILSILANSYYHIKYHTRYYDYINKNAYRLYNKNKKSLNPYAEYIVSKVKHDGVYADAIENISNIKDILNWLSKDADDLLKPILDARIRQNRLPPTRIMGIGRDTQHAQLPNSIVNFFLSDDVLNVVNACHGLLSRLNYVDVWYNMPATDDVIYYTERWHRDHEDIKMIKVFVYLSTVDETMGPFSYLTGTQYGGRIGHINPVSPPRGVAINDRQFAEITSLDQTSLKVFSGAPGTVIISDMTGVHKGGRTTAEPRTVVVATYTSDAGVDPHVYHLPESINPNSLSFAAKYAMRLE